MTRPEDCWPHVLQVMMAVMGVPHRLAWREGGLDPGAGVSIVSRGWTDHRPYTHWRTSFLSVVPELQKEEVLIKPWW